MSASYPEFSGRVVQCGIAAIAGVVLDAAQPGASLTLNILCLLILTVGSRNRIKANVEGFDHVVAAEAIVAFGVFSLVLGLGSVIFRFIFGLMDEAAILRGNLMAFTPFVEGLVTAGSAPVFAIWTRMYAAQQDRVDAAGDLDGLAAATSALVKQMIAAKTAIEGFGEGAARASASTHGLADNMRAEADKWALALVEAQAHVRTFGEASRGGSAEVSALSKEVATLKEAAGATATMLEELARLIEAIERFVEPRSRAKR